ncbi:MULTISPECIES: hypothetical protein [Nonomuraea]|uniref:Uncharacterized protein n=1 Tax=Nonomuraea mangrovi TaxID=2316207 RepID=A0ABW4TD36_9ACTN
MRPSPQDRREGPAPPAPGTRRLPPAGSPTSSGIATLLSDEGRWITAQNIEVSGGYDL